MKTKEETKKFDTVKEFRKIKEKVSKDLIDKTAEQIKEYLKQNSLKFQSEK